ncbi:MAG: peptidylprolyl isomerase [Gammaproteobacteria bacterium]|jgi:peptidyl-prolyl cis-trans isomerase C|nr:peptidylprolyl isomerase [Gammaproteobacteria bacterium]MBT4145819.1 peptidylprolyl isomerase [Gammaproteobacteria bacterium]MBT5223776.1 peptidylprolyl isomerase [Gammaproteobacteria bacterium]MBT5826835.1 peptidylprolyl isomerase [Gammaproteobacteria bacterium]MBT5966389.1 peptidylprolyl isomerase [Gammaproteobacteria bacterium]
MKLKAIPFLLASTIFVTGCQQNTNNAATPNIQKEDAAIVVNGQYISKSALDTLTKEVSERVKGQNYPKDKLIDQLIKTELLVQEAQSKGLDQTPETVERLAMMRASVLSQLAVEDYIKSNPVTDADLKAAYDKQIADTAGGTEYKARHILVKDEPEAVAIIAKLDKGADFATLAKENSTGPSKTQGGDLGWFGPKQMVAPFSEAVAQLEKGKYTKTPVQTQFGWHIIILEDIRVQTPPPFEAVKAQLEPLVQREKLTNYLDSLLSSAQVEILVPLTEPAPVATVVETVTEEVTPTSDTVTETIEVIPAAE